MDEALREAISRAGGMRALGRKLGISHVAIGGWKRCPPLRVLEIERLTGVPKEALRPDLYVVRKSKRNTSAITPTK